MKAIICLLPALLIAAALSGCSVSADEKRIEQEIGQFHALLDAGKPSEIYDSADEQLKEASAREDFVALLDAVHRKLGDFKSSSQKGWNVNFNTSGRFLSLRYETEYAEGRATAQFVYRITDERPLLVGYHVNSNALILK